MSSSEFLQESTPRKAGLWRSGLELPTGKSSDPSRRWSIRVWAQTALSLAFLLAGALSTPACRYNVRDVGFVDLENEPYHLYAFVRSSTAPNLTAALTRAASNELANANISFELINADSQTNHPALIHRPVSASGPDPNAVLLSPDGQSLRLPLTRPGHRPEDAVRTALHEVATSELREQLVAEAGRAFGVVLLIEGTQPESNRRARRAIEEAIEQIRPQMKLLPKAIASPPSLMTLGVASQPREKVLLWSLRLESEPTPEARAVVLYGRARWIGPLMRDQEITPRNLVGLFSMIGADCECGLDLSWTQGTRLPVLWPDAFRTTIAKSLGFDPESPPVKTEVSWILSRRGSGARGERTATPPPASTTPPAPSMNPALDSTQPAPLATTLPPGSITTLAALMLTALAAGIWIVRRAVNRSR